MFESMSALLGRGATPNTSSHDTPDVSATRGEGSAFQTILGGDSMPSGDHPHTDSSLVQEELAASLATLTAQDTAIAKPAHDQLMPFLASMTPSASVPADAAPAQQETIMVVKGTLAAEFGSNAASQELVRPSAPTDAGSISTLPGETLPKPPGMQVEYLQSQSISSPSGASVATSSAAENTAMTTVTSAVQETATPLAAISTLRQGMAREQVHTGTNGLADTSSPRYAPNQIAAGAAENTQGATNEPVQSLYADGSATPRAETSAQLPETNAPEQSRTTIDTLPMAGVAQSENGAARADAKTRHKPALAGHEHGVDSLMGGLEPRTADAAAPATLNTLAAADAATDSASPPTLTQATAPATTTAPTAPSVAPAAQAQTPQLIVASPADIPDIVAQTLAQNETTERISIQLDPPELGRVSIEFQIDDAGVHTVTVTGETSEALRKLRLMNFELLQALEQQGLGGRGFSLEYQQSGNPGDWQNFDHGSGDTDAETEGAPGATLQKEWAGQSGPATRPFTDTGGLNLRL